MNISDLFRALVEDVRNLQTDSGDPKAERLLIRAEKELAHHEEGVGEIPQMRLEGELTPVLLKVHNLLDRARLMFDEIGEEDRAGAVWETEQKIYRLLNSL
jgi:hypothetical protein